MDGFAARVEEEDAERVAFIGMLAPGPVELVPAPRPVDWVNVLGSDRLEVRYRDKRWRRRAEPSV